MNADSLAGWTLADLQKYAEAAAERRKHPLAGDGSDYQALLRNNVVLTPDVALALIERVRKAEAALVEAATELASAGHIRAAEKAAAALETE